MTCTEFLAKLDDLLDGEASAELKAELEEHLCKCCHCEVTWNTTRKTIEIYQQHELYELPDDVRTRLETAIMAKCQEKHKNKPPEK